MSIRRKLALTEKSPNSLVLRQRLQYFVWFFFVYASFLLHLLQILQSLFSYARKMGGILIARLHCAIFRLRVGYNFAFTHWFLLCFGQVAQDGRRLGKSEMAKALREQASRTKYHCFDYAQQPKKSTLGNRIFLGH